MPASLFSEMERSGGGRTLEDQRVLELALEMTMFGLSNENDTLGGGGGGGGSGFVEGEPRSKKSQNTTECVPVPSSEHVAEIVGRQGCKIKALRAKTNTYIKTPVRGEEPVFVVTGRKEDVNAAKREILSAAEHFSQIRAQRKSNLNGSLAPGPNSSLPGQTTIQVRVPYRVVGLVVGPKGATIKRIQQQTNTYIVTPSRDKEPIFEVTGMPDSVESARKEIEAHIAMRTGAGGGPLDGPLLGDDDFVCPPSPLDALTNNLNALNGGLFKGGDFVCPPAPGLLDIHPSSSEDLFGFSGLRNPKHGGDVFNIFNFSNGFGLYDVDEGLGDSPTFDPPAVSTSSWPDFGGTSSSSTLTDSGVSLFGSGGDLSQRSNSLGLGDLGRLRSDPLTVPEVSDLLGGIGDAIFSPLVCPSAGSSSNSSSSSSSSPVMDSLAVGKKPGRQDYCVVCYESAIVAALVPCGHNLFCLECASRICDKTERECPVCRQPASQAIRIYS